jgi:hypothetical protein
VNDVYRDFPFSEEGKKLNLSDDLFEKCKLVYKKNCETGKWEYAGMWDGSKITDLKKMVVPVQSVYGGVTIAIAGTEFVNVIGSTYDPIPLLQTSWIGLMKYIYKSNNLPIDGVLDRCCAENGYYVNDGHKFFNDCTGDTANPNVVGGHVLFCRPEENIAYPNTTVYLIPICRSHNRVDGRYYYMKIRSGLYAIKLDHFLCDDYLSRVEEWCRINEIPFPPQFY